MGTGAARARNSWYSGLSVYFKNSTSWITRGGQYRRGVVNGVFSFTANKGTGEVEPERGFRVVLTPQ